MMSLKGMMLLLVLVGISCGNKPDKERTTVAGTGDPDGSHCDAGAIVRGDPGDKKIALVFTGDEFAEGGEHIRQLLKELQIHGSFFLTGNFYRNSTFEPLIRSLVNDGHYLGAHSDRHLLYCDWVHRDSLLITRSLFEKDLKNNYSAMEPFGINRSDATFFLPPYEWYNDTISAWTRSMGLQLINHTKGTLSHADYTLPGTTGYRSSDTIFNSIIEFEKSSVNGLNGFILLVHIGSDPARTDKFYHSLEPLLNELLSKGYEFVTVPGLLKRR